MTNQNNGRPNSGSNDWDKKGQILNKQEQSSCNTMSIKRSDMYLVGLVMNSFHLDDCPEISCPTEPMRCPSIPSCSLNRAIEKCQPIDCNEPTPNAMRMRSSRKQIRPKMRNLHTGDDGHARKAVRHYCRQTQIFSTPVNRSIFHIDVKTPNNCSLANGESFAERTETCQAR